MCFFRITNLLARLMVVILTLMACACQQSIPQNEVAVSTLVLEATDTSLPSTHSPVTVTPAPSLEPTALPIPTSTSVPTATPLPAINHEDDGIAFVSNDKIHIVTTDGSLLQQLIPQRVQSDGFAWSPDGQQIAYLSQRGGHSDLFTVHAWQEIEPQRLTNTPEDEMHPAWSPDGTRLAYCAEREGNVDVYIMSLDESTTQRLTTNAAEDCAPDWSPDGAQIAFESNRDGNREIYILPVTSENEQGLQRVTTNDDNDYAPAWSPDGTQIAFYANRNGAYNIFLVSGDGTGEQQLTNDNDFNEWWPSWSSDGSEIVYCKMLPDYLHEIYVVPATGGTPRRLTTSTSDDWFPAWKPGMVSESSQSDANTTLAIPFGTSPTIDGTMTTDEWVDNTMAVLSDESELFLKHDDNYLYLGIRSVTEEMIGANVFIEHENEVMVLHTSAALGTAVYHSQNNTWQQVQAFNWKCRSTSNSTTAQAERTAYLEENQWLAANSRMGPPNELEYQIQLPDAPLRIAVTIFRSSNIDDRPYWPPTLNDDLIQPAPDGLGTQLKLSLGQWAMLEMLAENE